jgi:N-acetyltransferase B complex (NatB) non catalytic subunit
MPYISFLLGAPQLALDHYRLLNVKQVQNDTMSYLILSRATNFSLAATGDLTYVSECLESSHVYFSNSQEASDKSLFSHSVALTAVRLLSSLSRHSAMKSTHRQVLPESQLRTS